MDHSQMFSLSPTQASTGILDAASAQQVARAGVFNTEKFTISEICL